MVANTFFVHLFVIAFVLAMRLVAKALPYYRCSKW